MHNLNVKIIGPSSFVSTLNELKVFLKFNSILNNTNDEPNIILFHTDALKDKKLKTNDNETANRCAHPSPLPDVYL